MLSPIQRNDLSGGRRPRRNSCPVALRALAVIALVLLYPREGLAATEYRISLQVMGDYGGSASGKHMSQSENPGPLTLWSPVDQRYFAVYFAPPSVTIDGRSILVTIGDRTGATGPAYNGGNLKYDKTARRWNVGKSGEYLRVHFNEHDFGSCHKGEGSLTYAGKGPEEITCRCDADLDLVTGLSKTYTPGNDGRMPAVDSSLYRIEGSDIVITVDGDPPDARTSVSDADAGAPSWSEAGIGPTGPELQVAAEDGGNRDLEGSWAANDDGIACSVSGSGRGRSGLAAILLIALPWLRTLRRRASRGRRSTALLSAGAMAAGWLISGCSDDPGVDHEWKPESVDAVSGDSATGVGDAGADARQADGASSASDSAAESSSESGSAPSCKAGFSDCDGESSNGCEAQLQVDPRNCGTCGTSCHNGECVDGKCQVVTVRALIYAGYDAGQNCVAQTGAALDEANAKNLVPGLSFVYTTATKVVESNLAGQNVLVMPGGDSGHSYLNNSKIDGAAIQAFVSSGKGYFGTCAGAYAAARHTDGHYDGWGLAPNVTCKSVEYIGDLPVSLSDEGKELLGGQGTIVLHHYRGAAMNAEAGATPLALYADGKTGYKGYAAIVADTYGAGRTILSGPHPELEPSKPQWVARAVAWAAGRLTE